MRRDTRWWRKLRTKERLIIASLNNDNAFSLIIHTHTHTHPSLCSHATFNRAHSLLTDLFQFYFIPEINRLSTRFVDVVSFPLEKGKTGIKNWGGGRGKKSTRPCPCSSSTRLFARGVANYSTREGIRSKASSNHPLATALVTIVNGARPSTPLPL